MRRCRYRRFFRKNHGQNRIKRLALVVTIALIGWAVLSEVGLSAVSDELVCEAVRSRILSCVNSALANELDKTDGEFVTVSRDDTGKIISITADALQLNSFKQGVLSQLKKNLNGSTTVNIPLGSLTAIRILNGRGPHVLLKLRLESAISISFDTKLITAGVNQSCYKITATVAIDSYSQSKSFNANVSASATAVLAEAVIVGEVPSLVTQ